MSRVPDYLDPWRAAEQGRRLEGTIALAELPRVLDLLVNPEGGVRFELEFFRDDKRRSCVRGRVTATLELRCQRCLGPLAFQVGATLLLGLVQGFDEAERLPEEYDPLIVEGDRVRPVELVEDELILALPQVPMHAPHEACADGAMRQALTAAPAAGEPGEEEADNPFQVLAQLKKQLH
jgi:uncharacterized protein